MNDGGRQLSHAEIFNPLGLDSLQRILREELESRSRQPLRLNTFPGPGVYALYYTGHDFPSYAPLAGTEVPVYVGKASAGDSSYGDPANARNPKLYKRINDHRLSIKQAANNLRVGDFEVRALVVDDAWIVLAERALLRAYRPVLWNTIVRGFGSNPSGSDRSNARSIWDTVHPGRRRAGRLCNRLWTLDEMLRHIQQAVEISLISQSDRREAAVAEFRSARYPAIWKRQGSGIVVWDRHRFHQELDRLGIDVPPNIEYADPTSAPLERPDDDRGDDLVEL